MKRFEKVQERIQKYSIRKLSVGVGSVAIAALIFGSSLSSSTVAADEVGGGATAHYTYVEEQELTEQEKGLIKKGLPENLQTGENYYLIYRKQDGQAVLPNTGHNVQPLLICGNGDFGCLGIFTKEIWQIIRSAFARQLGTDSITVSSSVCARKSGIAFI